MVRRAAPEAGDLVWISFTPQAGREQAGRRPALVLSPKTYNARTGLCLACPITSQVKGFPFEVLLPADLPIQGVILADHVRSIDWSARNAEPAGNVPAGILVEVRARLLPLIAGA